MQNELVFLAIGTDKVHSKDFALEPDGISLYILDIFHLN